MATKIQKEEQFKENAAIEYLVSSGLDRRDSKLDNSSLEIYLSESQEQKVEKYCNVFGISVRTMLNSCIQYVLYMSKQKGVEVKELQSYPKQLGSSCYNLLLNAETLTKLKESGVEEIEEVSKYAVAGIKVLYDKNLNVRKKDTNFSSEKN